MFVVCIVKSNVSKKKKGVVWLVINSTEIYYVRKREELFEFAGDGEGPAIKM